MKQKILYISFKTDRDLVCLLKDIGIKNFRKCTMCCLRALLDASYIEKAKGYARSKIENGEDEINDYRLKFPTVPGIKLWLSFQGSQNEDIKELILDIRDGHVSSFVKSTIRQVLGLQMLLKYFLKEESLIQIKEVPFVSFISVGSTQAVEARKPRKKRKKTVRQPKKLANKQEEASFLTGEALNAPPSITPSFDVPVYKEKEEANISTQTSKDDDIDVLSMLEAMM